MTTVYFQDCSPCSVGNNVILLIWESIALELHLQLSGKPNMPAYPKYLLIYRYLKLLKIRTSQKLYTQKFICQILLLRPFLSTRLLDISERFPAQNAVRIQENRQD